MTLNKTDRIVITLGTQIVGGKYVPGSPLPAEAELCEEFETSRNIIREVFRSLMAKRPSPAGRLSAQRQVTWHRLSRL